MKKPAGPAYFGGIQIFVSRVRRGPARLSAGFWNLEVGYEGNTRATRCLLAPSVPRRLRDWKLKHPAMN